MSFEEVWEASRWNVYFYIHYGFLFFSVLILLVINRMKEQTRRRNIKLGAVFVFSYLSLKTSTKHIIEKWRIRSEWAELNPDKVTELQQKALVSDGANIAIAPLFDGIVFFLLLTFFLVLLHLVRPKEKINEDLSL